MTPAYIISAFIFGAIFGSFASAIAYRIPRGEQFHKGRSKCPSCGASLRATDLVPIFSWIFRGGKCGHCKAKISAAYPAIETILGLMFAAVVARFGPTPHAALLMAVSFLLIIMIVVDFTHYIIPDSINLLLFVCGVIYSLGKGVIMSALVTSAGMVIFALLLRAGMSKWKNQEALGLGDVKFFAVIGIFLPFSAITAFLLISGVLGIISSLFWRRLTGNEIFPFGPALAVSLWLCLIFPEVGGILAK